MKLYEGFSTGLSVILQEKLRSALTMLGIIIGIAAVLAMLAIGDGAKRIVMQEFEKYGGHFFRPTQSLDLDWRSRDTKPQRRTPEIRRCFGD